MDEMKIREVNYEQGEGNVMGGIDISTQIQFYLALMSSLEWRGDQNWQVDCAVQYGIV